MRRVERERPTERPFGVDARLLLGNHEKPVGRYFMEKIRICCVMIVGLGAILFLTACGDETGPPAPDSTANIGDVVTADADEDGTVSQGEEGSEVVDEVDDSEEVDESEPPTECELACYEQYQDLLSAEDCDAWCHATADQWLSGCLMECSSQS